MSLQHLPGILASLSLVVMGTASPGAQTTQAPSGESLTLTGCLMRHEAVPPRSGAPAVNTALAHEGYLLVDAITVPQHQGATGMPSVATATPPSAGGAHDHSAAVARPVVSPTPNVGDSQMFKVEGLSAEQLEPFAGKRATMMGDLILTDGNMRPRDPDHEAAPFKATMIHPADGPCRQ